MNFPFQDGRPPQWVRSSEPKQLRMSPVRWATSFPKQLVLTMQASAILLFAVCLQASATGLGQTVSFTGKDVPLKTVFTSIKKQTGYGVFYQNGEAATLEGTGTVTLDLKNVALDFFLQVALRNQPIEYSVEGTTIFVKKKETRASINVEVGPGTPIAEIHGRVTNDKGEPLVNANITVKRTGRGTITDANGDFILHHINSDDIVTVSFIGYKAQSVAIRDRSSLSVFMEPTTNDLDKVVVQAYGTTSQRLATGNIGVVRAEDIAKQPIVNPLEAIQGQVAGTVITNTGGYTSGAVKVEIRGRNTINPNFPSDPLYIIDGVPVTISDLTGASNYTTGSQGIIQSGIGSPANGQSPLFSLNPNDIESIEVLKDADATAIYGSRGANGVILITTKRGKAGKTHFTFNAYEGINQNPRYYKMLNTQQYVAMRKESSTNDGLPVNINTAADLVVWDTTRYTNWQKFLWGHLGKRTSVEGSLSGGDTKTTFRISAGYKYITEILTYNGANQVGNVSFSIDHKSGDQRFNILLTGYYSLASVNTIFLPGAITLPPNAPPIWDSKGNLNYSGWAPLDGYFPAGPLLQPYTSSTNFLNSNITISYELLKGLTLKSSFGYNNTLNSQTTQTPIISQDPVANPKGQSNFGNTLIHNVIVEPQLEYNLFISKGKLSVLLGASKQDNNTSSTLLLGYGYTNDALLTSIAAAPGKVTNNLSAKYRYAAGFGRINYNWADKYIININARRDGSSRFGPGRQFGNFASISGAWVFSEEKWIKKNLPVLSFGKLRGSYGTTGGDQIGNYAFLSQWSFSPNTYNGYIGIYPVGHSDSTLHWQVNRKLEGAIDLGFSHDRLTVEIAWYRNRCNDQLISFPTPYFTGFSYVTSNSVANVENIGLEGLITAKIINKETFTWVTKFNIGVNRNKLIEYPNLAQSPFADQYVVGKPLNILKLLHHTGVDPQTGLYAFQDKNHDGQINVIYGLDASDDRFEYDLSPKYDGGLTNNFRYKNWNLSIFFYFKKQLGRNILASLSPAGDNTNQPSTILSRWQKPGDVTNTARFTTSPYSYGKSFRNYFQFSDAIYTDASFIRLENISLSYSLPERVLKNKKISNITIYIHANNLFLITNYKGLDPEVQSFGTPPLPRIIAGGISLNL